jgi:putative flippase GtrA
LASVVVGRLSSLVNFALNKRFVFHNAASLAGSLWRYYALAATLGAICYVLISSLAQYAHWNVFAAKLVVETLLSLVSFSVQRTFVFPRGDSVVRSR